MRFPTVTVGHGVVACRQSKVKFSTGSVTRSQVGVSLRQSEVSHCKGMVWCGRAQVKYRYISLGFGTAQRREGESRFCIVKVKRSVAKQWWCIVRHCAGKVELYSVGVK